MKHKPTHVLEMELKLNEMIAPFMRAEGHIEALRAEIDRRARRKTKPVLTVDNTRKETSL